MIGIRTEISAPNPNNMEINTSKRVRRQKNLRSVYAGAEHRLQFYKIPPKETVSLQEFEEYAIERLKGKHANFPIDSRFPELKDSGLLYKKKYEPNTNNLCINPITINTWIIFFFLGRMSLWLNWLYLQLNYNSYNHEYLHISVLKGVENAGIRFMRGSEEYNALVEKEIKKTRLAKIIRVSSNVMITQ